MLQEVQTEDLMDTSVAYGLVLSQALCDHVLL